MKDDRVVTFTLCSGSKERIRVCDMIGLVEINGPDQRELIERNNEDLLQLVTTNLAKSQRENPGHFFQFMLKEIVFNQTKELSIMVRNDSIIKIEIDGVVKI